MESIDGNLLPVAGFELLRLLMDQEDGTSRCETQPLLLERVANVPGLEHHNFISADALAKTRDVPIGVHPGAGVGRAAGPEAA